MRIKSLEMKHFRGFQGEKMIQLKPQINVIVGVNGAGKSSILDLIAILLNQFTNKLAGVSKRELEYSLSQLDIHVNEKETVNKIHIQQNLVEPSDLQWEMIRDFENSRSNYQQLNTFVSEFQHVLLKNTNQKLPIVKYFHSQRLTNDKQKQINSSKRSLTEQLQAYEDAFGKGQEFDEFVHWFIEEENKENRAKIANKNFSLQNPKLSVVRRALDLFFGFFQNEHYSNLRVDDRTIMTKISEKSALVIDKNGKTFNLRQLSDGEKNMILIVSDIAHRLAIANPISDDKNTSEALEGEGIILIDEIDLHLHPAWQREIINCLISTFPKIQFIITTHSPQVLSNVKSENIIIIEDFNFVEITPHTFGNDSNTILWNVFGVFERPIETKVKIEKLYDIIENQSKKDEAKQLLNELSEQLGENNPEIVKAKLHFNFQND